MLRLCGVAVFCDVAVVVVSFRLCLCSCFVGDGCGVAFYSYCVCFVSGCCCFVVFVCGVLLVVVLILLLFLVNGAVLLAFVCRSVVASLVLFI